MSVDFRSQIPSSRTKIIATVGPACERVETLVEMIRGGVDVFRINTAHGSREDYARLLGNIRQAREATGFPVATLLDLAGPKIRLGKLPQDPLELESGSAVRLVRGEASDDPRELTSNYPRLLDELSVGDRVMLAEGAIVLRVVDRSGDAADCLVESGGTVRSRQGINLPGVSLSVSAMRPEDVENALWAARNEVDFVSLSFVRTAQDIHSLKHLLASMECQSLVIAKIEKREAMEQLESIVAAADGVMVARGDLGVEIDVAETPVAQKRIIQACREALKPVIVATQMLESMHHSRRPTRAEASDVANAILDGADACMLSGETAIGDYPVETVAMMNRIAVRTEELLRAERHRGERPGAADRAGKPLGGPHAITAAVTYNAGTIAEEIGAKLIVVASHTGGTAWIKAKQRNYTHTLGVSDVDATLRRMCLFWGIMPHKLARLDTPQLLFDEINRWGCDAGVLAPGDAVVYVTGTGVLSNAYNALVVQMVPTSNG